MRKTGILIPVFPLDFMELLETVYQKSLSDVRHLDLGTFDLLGLTQGVSSFNLKF